MRVLVHVCTWNMGNSTPPSDSDMIEFAPPNMDIYCFALQESTEHVDKYLMKIIGNDYVMIGKLTLWDIRMMVFVHEKHISRVTCLSTGSKGKFCATCNDFYR
jgi:hypothetical protein